MHISFWQSYNVKMAAIEPRVTTPVMGTYGYAAPATGNLRRLSKYKSQDSELPTLQSQLN